MKKIVSFPQQVLSYSFFLTSLSALKIYPITRCNFKRLEVPVLTGAFDLQILRTEKHSILIYNPWVFAIFTHKHILEPRYPPGLYQ